MKRILTVAFIVVALSQIACKKTSSNSDKVFIRIENATGENFSNFALNATDFGTIASGDTSEHRLCKNILPLPFANSIAINKNSVYILDVVPTPYLENGNYLMKVVSDTLPWRYQATFIKE